MRHVLILELNVPSLGLTWHPQYISLLSDFYCHNEADEIDLIDDARNGVFVNFIIHNLMGRSTVAIMGVRRVIIPTALWLIASTDP